MIFKKHYLSKKQKNKKKVLENKNIPAFSENSSWNTFLDFFSFFFFRDILFFLFLETNQPTMFNTIMASIFKSFPVPKFPSIFHHKFPAKPIEP